MTYLEEPTEDDEHLAEWLLSGFVLLTTSEALNPNDWDGISYEQFKTQFRAVYGTTIRNWLTNYHLPWLATRGIPVGVSGTSSRIDSAIEEAIADTADLHASMQRSFTTGNFSDWGGPTHQGLILRDAARIAGD